jgi:hypothetical protein
MSALSEKRWMPIVLSVISAILGILAGPVIENLWPPLFQGENLLYLIFLMGSVLFLLIGIYVISFGSLITKQTDLTQEEVANIAHSLSVRFTFVPVGKGNAKENYNQVARLLRRTRQEILVLNYGIVRRLIQEMSFDKDVAASRERQNYYRILSQKVKQGLEGSFRFRRIVQLPSNGR